MGKNYKEITLRMVVLKPESKGIIFKNAINIMDKYICSYSKEYHKGKGLKDYCVSRIEPAIYENFTRGDIISIKIRSDKREILEVFENKFFENDFLKVILIDIKMFVYRKKITEINSLTPVIFTGQIQDYKEKEFNRYVLTNRKDISTLKKAILRNALAKAGMTEEHDFIEEIRIKNNFPIRLKISRKVDDITYLGDKIEIKIKGDETSQKIALALIIKGLGRHCTCGNGFMNYKLEGVKSEKDIWSDWN